MTDTRATLVLALVVASPAGCTAAATRASDDAGTARASDDAGAAAIDGGAPAPAIVEVCPAPPVRSDFESVLDPSWRVTDESAFRIDSERPITGAKSLRIAFRQKVSYITLPLSAVCAVRIAFTLRADAMLSRGGVRIARVTVGPGTWFHLNLNGVSGLSLAQEMNLPGASGIMYGPPSTPIPADTPTAVVLTVDRRTKTTSLVYAPVGQPLPEPRATPMLLDPSDPASPGPIMAVEFGPGAGSPDVGILWMDDLAIE